MGKVLIKNYVFDATAKTIKFTDFPQISLDRLRLITDVTKNIILWNFADSTVNTATQSGNIITLSNPLPAGVASTDKLEIDYETISSDPLYDFNLVENAAIEPFQDIDRDTLKITQPAFFGYFQANGAITTNTPIMANTYIGDFSWMSITVKTGGAWTGTIKIAQSDETTQESDSLIYNADALDAAPATTITANGHYLVKKTGKWARAYYSAFTSGAAVTLSISFMTTPWPNFERFTSSNPLSVSATSLPLPTGAAQDGTDITSPTAMPAGGAGIRGWLSAIWTKLNGTIAVSGTFYQATQPVSGTVTETNSGSIKTDLDTIKSTQTDKTQMTRLTDGTSEANIQAYGTGQNGLTTGGAYKELTGLSSGALNADLITATDVSNYARFSIQVLGTFTGTMTVQGSNDGTNYSNTPVLNAASAAAVASASITTTGIYYGYVNYRFLRVRMTAYTSGTATGTAELYSNAGGTHNAGGQVTQSGTWNMTQLTSPWVTSDRGATGTATRPATSTTSATILASNASRKQAVIVNDSATNLYILFGSGTASAANYTYKLATNADKTIDKYTGAITGVLDSGTGSAQVTEVA